MISSDRRRRLFGIDVGGSSVKLGAVEITDIPRIAAQEVFHAHDRTPADPVFAELAGRVRAIARDLGWGTVDGVGLGVPGLVHHARRELIAAPNLASWNGLAVGALFEKHVPCAVRVDNDANAFALAEWLWGAGRGASDAVFLTLGTGIGGGVVAGGHMLRGVPGFASEPGHMIIERDGVPCKCGSRGCAERYVGIEALVGYAERHPRRADDPFLDGAIELTPKRLFEAAEAGSEVAREVWAEAGRALGVLLANLTNLLNPERIVIGGGIGQAGEWILGPARAVLGERSVVARHAPPAVVPAALGADAGLLGAAGLFVEPDSGDRG